LSGVFLGYLMKYNDIRPESAWMKSLAYACIVITPAVLCWAVISSIAG